MSSLPRTRRRSILRLAGFVVLATGAVVAAVAPGLSTLGAQMSSLVGSAELAAGSALQVQNGWMLPAAFTVTVFALIVGVTCLLTRIPAARAQVGSRSTGRPARISFELREPERALRVRIDRLPGVTE
ncbi:hypothetical protein [Dietzia sp. PP-33]|uniref:hypothetical protein n=1 Tax=Dietzia sp. PP-33 TaxID=2957500 RepID=UPI0029A7EB9E|nr:hypothetical protein [Dietzia sp. PP-33]MDX2358528.1 hypothetical protein [Dietzia sp. PP-33]